tara:strand:- start:7339 stop:7509 length:171 start_codon:yes stop_codon:yes gene_type:complete
MAKWRVKAEVCSCGDFEEYTLVIPDGQYPHDMLLLKESRKQWGEPAIKILDKWKVE